MWLHLNPGVIFLMFNAATQAREKEMLTDKIVLA